MTHILIPRTPSMNLLRPFIECPTSELDQAWAAMVRIAEVQHARAGSQCLAQIEGPAQPVLYVSPGQLANHSNPEGPESEKAGRYLPARVTPAGKFTQPLYAGAAPADGAPRARDLLGIVRTAQSEARRLINGEDSGSDLAQTKLDLPETLRVLEHALSRPAAVAGSAVGVKFFSASNEGLDEHDTAEAAQNEAQSIIDMYREEAADGWPEEVDSVCWGVILGKAVERPVKDAPFMAGILGSDMEPVDYVLEPVAAPALEAPAAGAPQGEYPHEQMDAMALARYKVAPSHASMLWSHAVVAGDGAQQLYVGREVECQNMARKFAGAFLDGAFAFHSMAAAPTAQAAPSLEAPAAPVDDRAEFEKWARQQSWIKDCQRYDDGRYGHYETEKAWATWQARAALAAAPQAPAAPSAVATQVIENLLQLARIVNTAVEDWGETKEDDSLEVIFHKEEADKLEEILEFFDSLPDAPESEGVILSGPSRAARVLRATAAPAAPAVDAWLQPADMAALQRFQETAEDDESYDIGKDAVARLCAFGCLQSHSFGRYSTTDFGDYLLGVCASARTLPFATAADRRDRAAQAKEGGAA
jgi:hypothetical protein